MQLERAIGRNIIGTLLPPAIDPDTVLPLPDICEWGQERFYVAETKRPIRLQPVQQAVLHEFFKRKPNGAFQWKTGLYSTIKKSGKTTIAALVQQWACECWGDYGEIYHIGNKLTQAKERAYKLTRYSIELSPWRKDWDIQALQLTYLPNNSFIKALPVNAAGEAGGNQRLTTWTEFHGYRYEDEERMWDELQPVPTQRLSFRFVESYAGFEGESNLLKMLWDRGLKGERLHDEYPIYGVPSEGLVAYIDTGIEARRMPWQLPEYYEQAEANERQHTFRRIHLNEWVTSQNALIDIALWDALAEPFQAEGRFVRVVAAVDASKSGDCSAVVVGALAEGIFYELETFIFVPPKGGTLDYIQTIKPCLEGIKARYQLAIIAYDEYQLHDFMTQLGKAWRGVIFQEFNQGAPRVKADTALEAGIRAGALRHSGNLQLREHMQNADGKPLGADEKALRIVKRRPELKIDGVVALSMCRHAALEMLGKAPSIKKVKVREV